MIPPVSLFPCRGRALAWAALAVLVCGSARAQELEELVEEREKEEAALRRLPGTETPGLRPEDLEGRVRLPAGEEVRRLRIAQDRAVDPAAYIVGPGDVMQLYVWGEFDKQIPFEVNPEGRVLVPTIGDFRVGGRTLAQVRQEIIGVAQADKYPDVDITLTLQSMRYFTVYIAGAVLDGEGAHVVSPVTRVSDLIERAGGFLDDFEGTERTETGLIRLHPLSERPTARRAIQVFHRDASVDTVDLGMFAATGDIRHNPYLRMGDVVHVGFRRHEVYAYGAVNREGVFEWRPGDTVGDLMRLAGGLAGTAPLDHVDLWRFAETSDSTYVIPLVGQRPGQPFREARLEEVADVELQPSDMLFLRARTDWRLTPTAYAHGQFRYQGRYRIVPGNTRLTELVERAGGLTKNANLLEARVIRTRFRAIDDPELRRLQATVSAGGLADLDPDERAYLKTKQREEKGRVAVDFERLFLDGDPSQDIQLEGGDVVYVPEKRLTVNLSGQFKKSGLVDYEEGRRAGYYLEQAGGFAYDADRGAAMVIRARTGQREEFDRNLLLEPGDEIWVPEKEYRDWWALFSGVVRTTADALTIILLVRAF